MPPSVLNSNSGAPHSTIIIIVPISPTIHRVADFLGEERCFVGSSAAPSPLCPMKIVSTIINIIMVYYGNRKIFSIER